MAAKQAIRVDFDLGIGGQRAGTDQHMAVLARLNDGLQLFLSGQQYRIANGGIALNTSSEAVGLLAICSNTLINQAAQRVQAHLA
ncbi:hypothetical protein D3C84_1167720 [compost metagenome]